MSLLSISKLGGVLLTDKCLQQDLNHMNKIKKLVLRLYLLRVCYYLDPEDIRKKLRNGVNTVVSKVDDFDYAYWNNCFHTNCMGYILYEAAKGNIPIIRDKFSVFNTFFDAPFPVNNDAPFIEEPTKCHLNLAFKYTPFNKISLTAWQKAFSCFVRFNNETEKYIEDELHSVQQERRVLGVIVRGTDYVKLQPKGHYRQPIVRDVIEYCKKQVAINGYSYIYCV